MLLRSLMTHVREQNWFAVVLDFLVVVVGIWIALLVSQWTEKQQRVSALERAEAEINEKLSVTYFFLRERLAIAPCRRERYRHIGDLLLSPDTQWTGYSPPFDGDEFGQQQALPAAIFAMTRPFTTGTWDALLRNGDLDEMSTTRRLAYTSAFDMINILSRLQRSIDQAVSRLQILRRPVPMSMSDRMRYYDQLAFADAQSAELEMVAEELIETIEREKLAVFTDRMKSLTLDHLEEIKPAYRAIYGDCRVDVELPLLGEQPAG